MSDHTSESSPPSQIVAPAEGTRDDLTFWERWGELLVAIGVIVLGIVVLVETQDIRTRPGVTVSPRLIPNVIGGLLVLLGIWYAIDTIRAPRLPGAGEDSEDVDPEAETNWSAIIIMAFALLCYALLIDTAGFIIASAVMFLISTFSMGSRHYVRNLAIGLILSAIVYFMFNNWLGVRLPGGWLAGILD